MVTRATSCGWLATAWDGSLQDVATSAAVTVVNSAPVADDETASTAKRTAVVVDVLVGDTDADGDVLSVGSVTVDTIGAGRRWLSPVVRTTVRFGSPRRTLSTV